MKTRKRIRALSAGTTLLMLLLVFSAFSASVFAQVRGPGNRVCAIEDNGNYLSDTQESVVLKAAKELSARRNINVILVTDEEKPDGYVNDDSGSEAYAADIYAKYTGARQSDQDDVSGFLFLLDMENRYLYIYTYDSVHQAVSNSKTVEITDSLVNDAKAADYQAVLLGAINGVDSAIQDHIDTMATIRLLIRILGPILVTGIVLLVVLHQKRSKRTTTAATYLDAPNCKELGDTDAFVRQTVSVTHVSSSSGGGGGGGGGHSGGGGSHF